MSRQWNAEVRRAIPLCKEPFTTRDILNILGERTHLAKSGVNDALWRLKDRGELEVFVQGKPGRTRPTSYRRTGQFVADRQAPVATAVAQQIAAAELQKVMLAWGAARPQRFENPYAEAPACD